MWQESALDSLPYVTDERLDNGAYLMTTNSPVVRVWRVRLTPRNVCHFEINLSKFRLAILAAVLIAETFGDLEVFVDCSGAYEELLGLLG